MKRTFWVIVLILILSVSLCGCSLLERFSPEYKVTELTQTVSSAEDLAALDIYPNLAKLDLRGSNCYDAILSYIASHPQVEVTYDISLAGQRWSPDTAELTLADGSFDVNELIENIRYLPRMKRISLPSTTLDLDTLASLSASLPGIELEYTVNLLGEEISPETESLDLSALYPEQLDKIAQALKQLPRLTSIQLMNAEGTSNLSMTDVKKLMDIVPGVTVEYSFELYGNVISTADERVEFLNVPIGNEGVEAIRQALDILPNCTYLLMDTCGVDNEVMAQLREDYADRTKVVWRVWLVDVDYNSKLFMRCGSYLTDTHRIRTTYVSDANSHVLNYCNETKYVDVGHVWQLTQCEFLAYMPDLEVCIIAITEITDITPLANHDKLEYLEIFTTDISDISPLASCPNLEHLNLSNMPYLDDITPVFGLTKLKRLRMVDSPLISSEEMRQAAEALPNCQMLNNGHFATAGNWRWQDPEKQHKVERYELLCEQMEYTIDAYEYGIP